MKLTCQVLVLAFVLTGCSSSGGFGRDAETGSTSGVDTATQPIEGSDTTDGSDATTGSDSTETTDGQAWPPALQTETDEAAVENDDTSVNLLGGEAVLDFSGTDLSGTTITIARRLVDMGDGVELVGYIWGPHGVPIDPSARVSFILKRSWLPPGATPETAELLLVPDGGLPTPLPNQSSSAVGNDQVRLSGDLSALGTIAIGPIPSP